MVNDLSKEKYNLKSQLKEKGFKMTAQRQAILNVLEKNEGSHLSAEEVYESLKLLHPDFGIATVYRTLQPPLVASR